MGTLSEKLTRIKDAMTQIRSGFDLEDTVIESVASTTTELHASQTQTLAENTATIQDLNTTLNARNNEINRLNATVSTQETTIQSQAQTITTLNATVDAQVVQISTLENTIATKDATINELNETILSKDAEIANLNARIDELEGNTNTTPEQPENTIGEGRISISMLDGGLDGSSRDPLSTDYTMHASIYTKDDVFVKSGSGTNPFDITGLADGEYYCVIDSVTDASGKVTHEAQWEKYSVTVTNGYGSVYGSVNLLAE